MEVAHPMRRVPKGRTIVKHFLPSLHAFGRNLIPADTRSGAVRAARRISTVQAAFRGAILTLGYTVDSNAPPVE